MFCKGKDKVVGMFLKIIVIEKYYDFVFDYLDNCDILKVMRKYFIFVENDKNRRYVYEWIIYICLKGKFIRFELFDVFFV